MAATRFTALILFTGANHPEANSIIYETLSPFAVSIIDARQFLIRDRVFSTALIELDPAHAPAIESDLVAAAERIGFDVAIDLHPDTASTESHSLYRNTLVAPEFSPSHIHEIFAALSSHGSIVTFTSITKTAKAHELLIESTGLDPITALRALSSEWKAHA
jgi:phosphoserine phosphatase